ncbi:MAG TPA: radical SAM protein [Planctomycetota bacterium]|nr:radical SAM protein [Planctomycetota bacterium]
MVPEDIDERIARAGAAYRACNLCERRCGDDRLAPAAERKNYCGLGAGARIFNELLHFGEELELIPSHAVYLTGCNFRCVFCMTGDHIVPEGLEKGAPLEPASFARLVARRRAEGATNVNFLGGEPSVNLLAILEALRACPRDTRVVWNSNMYFSEEQAALLRGVVDVYLADWKYGDDACALKLSAAPRYLEVVRRNLRFARESARLIVRYLVMPGHNACCLRPIARMMAEELPGVPLSILDPYVPLFRAPRVKGMDRGSTRDEAVEARAIAREHRLEIAE